MKSILKWLACFLLGCCLTVILFVTFGNEDFKQNLAWSVKDQPKLTLESFDLHLPNVEDPRVMLQLSYKMIAANRPFHAIGLIDRALEKAKELHDLNLQAEAHYTYGAILHTEPFTNYQTVIKEAGIDLRRLSGFEVALTLYQENNNYAGVTLANYALGWRNYWRGRPFACGYFARAREAITKIEDKSWLNTAYVADEYATFEEQLFAAENTPLYAKCENYTKQPDFWKKFETGFGFGQTSAGGQKRPFNFPPLACGTECQKIWKNLMDQVKARVELPAYDT
ncbi:MAG: hypothetical protein H7A01_05100 [Hahellaceae bacterium]|nr:hypothetical protein [Hahellaceae bacterium]MCP5212796.1 hypothetical protein [Hahellaceae bacterium]